MQRSLVGSEMCIRDSAWIVDCKFKAPDMGYVEHYAVSTLTVRSFTHPTHVLVCLLACAHHVHCQIHPHLLCAPHYRQNCTEAVTQSSSPPKLVIILMHGGSNYNRRHQQNFSSFALHYHYTVRDGIKIFATTKLVIILLHGGSNYNHRHHQNLSSFYCTEAAIAIAATTKTFHHLHFIARCMTASKSSPPPNLSSFYCTVAAISIAATTKTCHHFIIARRQEPTKSSPPPHLSSSFILHGDNNNRRHHRNVYYMLSFKKEN